jgi:hypothetical protein
MKYLIISFLSFLSLIHETVCFGQSSRIDLDHVILWTAENAPDTSIFKNKGFMIDSRSMQHMGFGTGGRYLFFYNIYIELFYVTNDSEYQSKYEGIMDQSRPNWKQSGSSPFGLGLAQIPYDTTNFPFPVKSVQAPWMKPNSSLFIATSVYKNTAEPMALIVPPYMVHPKYENIREIEMLTDSVRKTRLMRSTNHPNGIRSLSHLKLTCTESFLSSTMVALNKISDCEVVTGKEHLLELTFDKHIQNKTFDFRPNLDLVIYY